ncbi:PadR family transcriptional regulator [Microtetraspora fusca]|uniref:PadR family transcriptional regulator n=1 Tax=Microtetraspora fusca TaxID=1997 RepID=A0ABW6VI75_MICFU|nr:PadR family transcriptional regulator [Microtetraspora fusca]
MSLRHAMLGLLARGPASGYDLLKLFEISLSNVWPATQSQLYAELGRLADTGLVKVVAEGPRGRKEYAITDEGMAELRHWITDVEPNRSRRSDMLLRVFFLNTVEPDQARQYLRDQAAAAAKQHEGLTKIREIIADGQDALSVYGRIAVEWGLRFSAMQREWAEWAVEEIDQLPSPTPE